MLTDYHVHLRQDEPHTEAERFFTSANAERYREAASELGIAELGVSEHVHRFADALAIWQHPLWQESATDDVDAYCGFVTEETDLRLGIEMDFLPGREDHIQNFLDGRPWDYVVGSVHFLKDDAVDHEGWDVWEPYPGSPDKIWARYFETVAESARSGLFDIIAHPDLVKIWGRRRPVPDGDLRRFYAPFVEAVAESGVAVELSTAGLRKPVGEIYPAPALLAMLADAGAVIALSSDAHVPGDVGAGYDQAMELLAEHDIAELAVFEGRQRRLEPIGRA